MQDSGHTPEWSGPKVERTLRNGKQIYFSAFKAWLVEQAGRPGASVSGLALRNGVNAVSVWAYHLEFLHQLRTIAVHQS